MVDIYMCVYVHMLSSLCMNKMSGRDHENLITN